MVDHYKSEAEKMEGLSRKEIVKRASGAETNSLTGRTGRLLLTNKIADDLSDDLKALTASITTASTSQDKLTKRLWWLNCFIAIATFVMATKAAIDIYDWWIK